MKHFNDSIAKNVQCLLKHFTLVLGVLACFALMGCEQVLPVPHINAPSGNSSNSKTITAPLNVIASNGLKGKINISWQPVNDAALYYIYKADSPHSEFVQINEVSAASTEITLNVAAGFSGYFKVAAVNPLGEISDLSLTAYGTSLANPIITAIENDSINSAATVYWYMENLNSKSYLDKIQFLVTCYDANGNELDSKLLTSTEETFCTFENLSSGTKYFYDVEAYLVNDQASTEKSLKLDADTAYSLIPEVANFTVTEGTKKDQIELTITLPQMAKVLNGIGSGASLSDYEDKPLYFKIERYNEATSSYEIVAPYVAFNGDTTEIAKDSEIFDTYSEGAKITWNDTIPSVTRGIKYNYRVLSYVDNNYEKDSTTKRISVTHDAAKAKVHTGWIPNLPAINSIPVKYTKANTASVDNPDALYEYTAKAETKLSAVWNSMGNDDYVFLLVEHHFKIKKDNDNTEDTIGNENVIKPSAESFYFTDISAITNLNREYNFEAPVVTGSDPAMLVSTDVESNKAVRGYYKYSIYVIPKATAEANADPSADLDTVKNAALVSADDSSNRLVTNGAGLPEPQLTIADGYANKAEITFSAPGCNKFKLIREKLDSTGAAIVGEDFNIDPKKDDAYTGSYTDTGLASGTAYQYTLYASNDDYDDIPSSTIRAYTLGTPSLTFNTDALDYNTFSVKWKSVVSTLELTDISEGISINKNVTYTVTHNGIDYTFADGDFTGTTNEVREDAEKTYLLTVTNGTDYNLKIKKNIMHFEDAATPTIKAANAGKNMLVTLKASNDLPDNHTSSSAQARVLGPAQTGLTTTTAATTDSITVTWNEVPGAKTYLVRRICPKIKADEDDKEDDLYIAKDGTVTFNGEPVSDTRTQVSVQGSTFILTDHHCSATDITNAYETNQAKIAWGLEYRYTVFPVLAVDDNPFENGFKVTYTNPDDPSITKAGYTAGYGLNIVATKADSPDSVTVSWTKPNTYAHTQPSLWYRKEGTTEWQGPSRYTAGTVSKTIYLDDRNLRSDKVEFAVTYETNNNVQWKESYLNYLAGEKDTDQEPMNVGYQFTLTTFESVPPVAGAETFSETVRWALYNSTTDSREKRPGDGIEGDCYEIQVLNKNCSDKWYTIATIAKDGTVHNVDTNGKWYDVALTPSGTTGLTVTALNSATKAEFTTTKRLTRGSTMADAITGEHDGLLKVQRDYKHYYRMIAKRKNSTGTEIKAVLGDITSDYHDTLAKAEVVGVRKITDDEFVKGISLIVADALLQCGVHSGGTKTISGANNEQGTPVGSFHTTHPGASKKFEWGTGNSNYIHNFRGGLPYEANDFASKWTINISDASDSESATYNQTGNIPWGTAVIKHETNLPSYQGSVLIKAGRYKSAGAFTVTKYFDLSIQYSHKTSDLVENDKIIVMTTRNDSTFNSTYDNKYTADNNSTMFYSWFPYPLGADLPDGIKNQDSNQPLYKNKWWEVRD